MVEESHKAIVLYPWFGISHLVPMVELAKLITKHHPSFSITILITKPAFYSSSSEPYIASVTKTTPSITFHYLPTIPLDAYPPDRIKHFELLKLNNPLVHQAFQSISSSSIISALIVDMFCSPSIDLAIQLQIPVYCLFTPNLSMLSIFLNFPTFHRNTTMNIKDMQEVPFLHFPGVPPIPPADMPDILLDRASQIYELFLYYCVQIAKTRGILVNSFDVLEPRPFQSIIGGECLPVAETPPVYCMGPLVQNSDNGGTDEDYEVECLEWLDLQPKKSVVFLCFGSAATFPVAQLKEIAIGLEMSGQRFLWVVRAPTPIGRKPAEPDLDILLPGGFLERTKGRGLVVKSWVPQVKVLRKESVGGFVTHCGWSSVLEGISAKLPLLAWPVCYEQRTNKVILVGELKVALPIEEGEGGIVSAGEVERRVRELLDMESEEGRVIRERVSMFSDEAQNAISEGGSSVRNLDRLAKLWKPVSGFANGNGNSKLPE